MRQSCAASCVAAQSVRWCRGVQQAPVVAPATPFCARVSGRRWAFAHGLTLSLAQGGLCDWDIIVEIGGVDVRKCDAVGVQSFLHQADGPTVKFTVLRDQNVLLRMERLQQQGPEAQARPLPPPYSTMHG